MIRYLKSRQTPRTIRKSQNCAPGWRQQRFGVECLEGRECPTVTFSNFLTPSPPDPMLSQTPTPNPGNLNELRFHTDTFASQTQTPATSDSENSDISFTITAGTNLALGSLNFSQFLGDTTVQGLSGAAAQASIQTTVTVTITQLDGTTAANITNAAGTTSLTYTSGGVFNLATQSYLNDPFVGSGVINVDGILTAAGLTAGRASQVSVRIQTSLQTSVSGFATSFIGLKDAAVTAIERDPAFITQNNGFLAGVVYVDSNNNGIVDGNEIGIGGVTITLFQGNTQVSQTTTDPFGYYQFTNLAAGTYRIVEGPTPQYLDGKDTVGTLGALGFAPGQILPGVGDQFIVTLTTANSIGVGYNFGELGLNSQNTTKRSFLSTAVKVTGPLVVTGLTNRFGTAAANLPLIKAFQSPVPNFNASAFALALGLTPLNQNQGPNA